MGMKGASGCFLCCCFGRRLTDKKDDKATDKIRLLGEYISPKTFGLKETDIEFVDQGELVYLFERPRQIANIRKYCLDTLMKIRP